MNNQIIPGIFYAELDESQKGAIRLGIELGTKVKQLFPSIAKDYRKGKSLSDLVKEYNIKELFNIKEKVAQMAVYWALIGYDGHFRLFSEPTYSGLMSPLEVKAIAKNHHIESGRRLGLTQGKRSGQITFEKRKGVHGLSYTEKRKYSQKGIIEQGNIPWEDEEIKKLYELSQDAGYKKILR